MLRQTLPCSLAKFTRSSPLNRLSSISEQRAVTYSSKGLQIRLHVKPNSKADRIVEIEKDCIHVAIVEAARDGEANRGIIRLITQVLGVRKTDASIIAGAKSRQKVLLVTSGPWTVDERPRREDITKIFDSLQQAASQ